MNNTIYLITNKVNNKQYVGQTWETIQERWQKHYSPSEKTCVKLNRAIRKYGKDNFVVEKLTNANCQQDADRLEIQYIQQYDTIKSGYNIRMGGSRGKHSDETRLKMSIAATGRKQSDEAKRKMSIAKTGVPLKHNGQFKRGQVSLFKGKRFSDESKLKSSISHRKPRIYSRKANHEQIICDYKTGCFSLTDLEVKYGIRKTNLSKIIRKAGINTKIYAKLNWERKHKIGIENQKNV